MSDAYDGLDGLIGKVKRAAIDVYMTDEANFYEVENDGQYLYKGSAGGMPQRCTRPGADGEGGGDVSLGGGMPDFLVNHLDDDFRSAFDTIRGRVDEIFSELKDIPRGDSLYYEENRSMEAAAQLTPGGVETKELPGGGSALELNNPALTERVGAIYGLSYALYSQTILVFREAYADRLASILDGQAALAATLGMAAAGQRAVFTQLREDIVTFAKNAEASLAAQAEVNATAGGSADSFKVAGALLGAASAAGPGALALAGAGAAAGLIGEFWPDPPQKKTVAFPGSDLDSIMSSIGDGKTTLLEGVIDDETAIRNALVAAHGAVREEPAVFDLAAPKNYPGGYGEDVSGQGGIQHSRTEMQKLAGNCELAAEEIGEARAKLESMNGGSGEWQRPAGIGISSTGPFSAFDDLAGDAVVLTRNTASELTEAAQKIIKASLDFDATDSDISKTLAKTTSQIRSEEKSRDEDLVFG